MSIVPAPEHHDALSAKMSELNLKGDILGDKTRAPDISCIQGDGSTLSHSWKYPSQEHLSNPFESPCFTAPSADSYFVASAFPPPPLKYYVPSAGSSISSSMSRTMENLTSWPWNWNGSSMVSISPCLPDFHNIPPSPIDGTTTCNIPSCTCSNSTHPEASRGNAMPTQPFDTLDPPILAPLGEASISLDRRGDYRISPEAGTMQAERGAVIGADIFDDAARLDTERLKLCILQRHAARLGPASDSSNEAREVALLPGTIASKTSSSQSGNPSLPSLLLPRMLGDDGGCAAETPRVICSRQESGVLNISDRPARPTSRSAKTWPAIAPTTPKFKDLIESANASSTVPDSTPTSQLVDDDEASMSSRRSTENNEAEIQHAELPLTSESTIPKRPEDISGIAASQGANAPDGRSWNPPPSFQPPSKCAQSSKLPPKQRSDERRTFITSPLYAQMATDHLHHPILRRNTTPKDVSDLPRRSDVPGDAHRTRHRRSSTAKVRMGQDNLAGGPRARPSLERRQSVVPLTSLPLDMVASSLGSFSWNDRSHFLAVHQMTASRSALRAPNSAPDPRAENISGYFDTALGRASVTGQPNGENITWPPSSRRQNIMCKESNETPASDCSNRNITVPLRSLPLDGVSYAPALRSSPASTPSLTYASGPSSPSHSDSASIRSKPRSIFGGPPLPEDIERRSAIHAAKIAERRQKRRAALEAHARALGQAQAQEQGQAPAPKPSPILEEPN